MKPAQRWAAYAAAGAATLAAMAGLEPAADEATATVLPAPRRGEPPRAAEPATVLPPLRARVAVAPLADPFAAQAAVVPVQRPITSGAAPAAAAPAAPPLPFSYLGQWTENGQRAVFLQRDGRTYAVRSPGPLDAEYAVLSIDERQLTLRYLPLGTQAALRFDAPPAAVPAAPGTFSAAGDGGEPQPDN
jgi:hypothetical protein